MPQVLGGRGTYLKTPATSDGPDLHGAVGAAGVEEPSLDVCFHTRHRPGVLLEDLQEQAP